MDAINFQPFAQIKTQEGYRCVNVKVIPALLVRAKEYTNCSPLAEG